MSVHCYFGEVWGQPLFWRIKLFQLCWRSATIPQASSLEVFSHIYLTFTRSAVVLHTLCFGIAEISLVVLKMELIFLFLILLPPREGETAVLYWAIIYLTGNFLIWTFSNLHRSRKQSMVNFFQSPITCFCIYQHFVKPGSSISTQFFPQSILKEISNIILLYLKIFQYTSSRPF